MGLLPSLNGELIDLAKRAVVALESIAVSLEQRRVTDRLSAATARRQEANSRLGHPHETNDNNVVTFCPVTNLTGVDRGHQVHDGGRLTCFPLTDRDPYNRIVDGDDLIAGPRR